MRLVVLADRVSSAEGYAGIIARLGHEAWTTTGSASAMALVQEARPDALLVALSLDTSALRPVIERARATSPGLPVVVALSEDSWWLRVPPAALAPLTVVRREGLTPSILEAALGRLGFRRGVANAEGALRLDVAARQLDGPRGRVRLTPAEGALLTALLDGAGSIVSHQDLAVAVWGDDPVDRPRMVALRTHMYEVRRKLEAVGMSGSLLSEPGRGYRLAMS